jgi:hypothetical protein
MGAKIYQLEAYVFIITEGYQYSGECEIQSYKIFPGSRYIVQFCYFQYVRESPKFYER